MFDGIGMTEVDLMNVFYLEREDDVKYENYTMEEARM